MIRQAKIVSDSSGFNNKTVDVLVESGVITEIKKSIAPKGNVKVIEAKDLHLSSGWIDMQAVACDPGLEHKENLDTLMRAAASGGFTAVCVHR